METNQLSKVPRYMFHFKVVDKNGDIINDTLCEESQLNTHIKQFHRDQQREISEAKTLASMGIDLKLNNREPAISHYVADRYELKLKDEDISVE